MTDVEPLAHGKGFTFYGAFWEDEPCILLLQESLSCGVVPLEFDCVETSASFEDVVQPQFVTWEPSDYVNTGNGVKGKVCRLIVYEFIIKSDYRTNGWIYSECELLDLGSFS